MSGWGVVAGAAGLGACAGSVMHPGLARWPVAVAALLGACAGSLLNLCVARWPAVGPVPSGWLRCARCSAPIDWRGAVPVVGHLVLRGRCEACDVRHSPQRPLVEVASALIWAGMAAKWGPEAEAARGSLLFTILLGIALADARTYIIPDQFTLGGAALGVLLAPLAGGIAVGEAVAGAALGFGLLWLVAWGGRLALGREALGGGDIKMMAMVGAFLGPAGVLLTLLVGALAGAIIFGPVSLRTGRLVPFGVFLAMGAGIAYVWGEMLTAWYLRGVLGFG